MKTPYNCVMPLKITNDEHKESLFTENCTKNNLSLL